VDTGVLIMVAIAAGQYYGKYGIVVVIVIFVVNFGSCFCCYYLRLVLTTPLVFVVFSFIQTISVSVMVV
jgi:hypothetical protein